MAFFFVTAAAAGVVIAVWLPYRQRGSSEHDAHRQPAWDGLPGSAEGTDLFTSDSLWRITGDGRPPKKFVGGY